MRRLVLLFVLCAVPLALLASGARAQTPNRRLEAFGWSTATRAR